MSSAHLFQTKLESMGTRGELIAWVEDDALGRRAQAEALRVFAEVSRLMGQTGESDIARINAHAHRTPVQVAPWTYAVLQRAQAFSQRSGGLFDVTFAALNGVWRFDQLKALPDEKQLSSLLGQVSYKDVQLKDGRVSLAHPYNTISVYGIAKGFAVDRAVEAIRQLGLRHFVLKLGGDLYVSGRRGERKWKIGVRDPRGNDSFAELEVEDKAFSTSGDYERFAVLNGVRYHHILDPRTGYPATGARAVSVLAPDCTTAEGLTKILFIGGREHLLPGTEAIIVNADNTVWQSPGLGAKIVHAPTHAP